MGHFGEKELNITVLQVVIDIQREKCHGIYNYTLYTQTCLCIIADMHKQVWVYNV